MDKMKDIIRDMLQMAIDEKNLDLAILADDLMSELASTYNAPSNWRNILAELYTEFQDNEWLVNAVFEFGVLASFEEE